MGFKKYLVGADYLPTDFAIGGLPLFSDDIKQLETNAAVWGITSVLHGWSVILSGCLVDQVDTDSNTITVTSGLVYIDHVVYRFDGYTGTYPFSITPGVETTDERVFKDGNLKSVAVEYDYAIRTSFTTVANKPYPSDLNWNEIYFDPFCGQRAEIVLNNLQKEIGETKVLSLSSTTYQDSINITRTETNNPIIGSTKPNRISGGFLRWGNIGYTESGDNTQAIRHTNNMAETGNSGGGGNIGDNEFFLNTVNIPLHTHEFDMEYNNVQETGQGFPKNGFLTKYIQIDSSQGDLETKLENGLTSIDTNRQRTTNFTNNANAEAGFGGGDLPVFKSQQAVDIENYYIVKYSKIWNGYATTNTEEQRSFIDPSIPIPIRFI